MLTTNEALCLEYSNRTGEARYVNRYTRSWDGSNVSSTVIEAHKGMNCIAYAKDGQIFRSVMGNLYGPIFHDVTDQVETAKS